MGKIRVEELAAQAVLRQDRVPVIAIFFVLRFRHVEVVAPAGQFQPVVTKRPRLLGDRVKSQVGPLAGEQRCCA